MRHLYTLLHYVAMPLIVGRLVWRGLRNRAYWRRWNERFGFGVPPSPRETVWVHAVSVGEVQAALPIVRRLNELEPRPLVVVTTTTPTGSERVRQTLGDAVAHCYVPFDLPGAVRRFLDAVRPRLAIVMETELWPNLLHACRARGVPVLLANVRLSARSAAGYARVRGLAREMLHSVSLIAVQSREDADRLVGLGADPQCVHVTGSVKFDVRLPASLKEESEVLRRQFGVARDVWIAASTHEGEERVVLDALGRVRESAADCLLVLVPRHPDRAGDVAALCRRRGWRVARRSARPLSCEDVDVYVGDTLGELPLMYAASDVAFVGGSLASIGGHNVLEPAALGIPVIVGPHLFNFAEISRRLLDLGVLVRVHDAPELAAAVTRYLADGNLRHNVGERARAFVQKNRGALDGVMALVSTLLEGPAPAPLAAARAEHARR